MTESKKFKDRVRERMQRTGERYTTARRNLEAEKPESTAAQAPEAAAGAPQAAQAAAPTPSTADPQAGYRENRRSFREESVAAWRGVLEKVAGSRSSFVITDLDEMVALLSTVARDAPLNHLLYPDGGGNDLDDVKQSVERGCLELVTQGIPVIVRPLSLEVALLEGDPLRDWAYLRLETGGLKPSGVYESPADHGEHDEVVLELQPGEYEDRLHWETGTFGADEWGEPLPLPDGARQVRRYFGGPFLLVGKASPYMAIDRYDGRHATLPAEVFREQMRRLLQRVHQLGRYGVDLDAPPPPAPPSSAP